MLRYYYYRSLSKRAQEAYKAIAIAIRGYKPCATFESVTNLKVVLDAVKNDNPHFFFVDWYNVLPYVEFLPNTTKLYLRYNLGREESKRYLRRAETIAGTLKADNDYNTVKNVHDYLVQRVKYDKIAVEQHKFRINDHRMIGALFENYAVCEGIARATQFLLRELGVECTYVSGYIDDKSTGTKGNHAWNHVIVNNELKKLDVTWDLCLSKKSALNYSYFCASIPNSNK